MREGGGKQKGSSFERVVCTALSVWITEGSKSDLFTRNVLSGGKFTISQNTVMDGGLPGDIAAAHPLAYAFLMLYVVECKHYHDLQLEQLLHKPFSKTWIGSVIAKVEEQAQDCSRDYILIAKQDRIKELVFVQREVGLRFLSCTHAPGRDGSRLIIPYHSLYNNTIMVFKLEDVLTRVDINKLMAYGRL